MGGDKTEKKEESKSEEAPTQESLRQQQPKDPAIKTLEEKIQTLERQQIARAVCDKADVKPSATLLESLVALGTEAKMTALVEEVKGSQAKLGGGGAQQQKAKSASQAALLQESQKAAGDGKNGKAFDDAAKRLRYLRGAG